MPQRLVECVPNYSEGRDATKIDSLAGIIEAVPEVVLLDRQSDADHNRSVMTFAGPPEAVAEAALRAVERAARERGFRVVFLRPTILYARNGDTSMIDNFCRLAKRGVVARLYPRDARHHLCHLDILRTVACRIVEQRDRMLSGSSLVVADPYTITSRQMEALIRRHLTRKAMTVPVPAPLMSALLLRAPHFKNPKLDIHTWGEIFGVFHLDTVYDPFETFRSLGIDPTQFEMDKTLLPFLQRAFQPESISERTPDTAATPRAA